MVQVSPLARGSRFHMRRVRAVGGLGNAHGKVATTFRQVVNPLGFLLLGAVVNHQQQADIVADDGVFILQVVVQAQPPRGKVFADDRHVQVAAVLAAVFLWRGKAEVAGGIGAALGFQQQLFPLFVGQSVALPVGARVFAAVIEETVVVILHLQRQDLCLDKIIQFLQVRCQVLRDIKIHHGQDLCLSGRQKV